MRHLATAALSAGLDHVRQSPTDGGTLDFIVARPAPGERRVLGEGELALDVGLVGDNWIERSSTRTADRSPHPDMQLNVINARISAQLGEDEAHRALCGDQLHIDLDLSPENLPAGTRLAIGDRGAVIEITDQPHTGCAKFRTRFGGDALKFVNTGEGKARRLRGINARVVVPGPITTGDPVRKLS